MGEKRTIVNIIGATIGSVSIGDGSSSTGTATSSGTASQPPEPDAPAAPTASKGSANFPIDFAILTAIEVERRAVCAAFGFGNEHRVKKSGRWYWRGQLALADGSAYEIVVAQPAEMGQVEATALTKDVLRDWMPSAALLVGIAATTDPAKVKLGDIVVGKSIWYYEHGKVTPEGIKPQPEMIQADAGLLQHFTGMADWDGQVGVARPDGTDATPKVHAGVIASGEKVIADAAVRDEIASGHRKMMAIAMEDYGFARAIGQSTERVQHLVIRAICDDASEDKTDGWHGYAAGAAAGFAKHFLLDRPLDPQTRSPEDSCSYPMAPKVVSRDSGRTAPADPTARTLASTEASLAMLRETLEGLVDRHEAAITLQVQEDEFLLEQPAVVEHLSRRRRLVQQLQHQIMTVTWLAISGQVGVGKTHAGTLLAEALGRCDAWVRLRDVSDDVALRRLNAALACLARRGGEQPGRIEEVARQLGTGGFVVLDDIPRLRTGSAFWERLVTLTKAFARVGAKLVTTSNHAIPTRIRELASPSLLAEQECPLFDDDEVAEVLSALGAPETLLNEKFVSFLRALSRGHPVLVSAAGRYLRQHQWQVDASMLENLLRGGHVVDIGRETLERLIESVEDVDGRELLYRLKLVTGAFTDTQVLVVAAVPRQVERPQERLAHLLGSWVQRDGRERYVLSPLLTTAPGENLLPGTERGCHFALAEALRHRSVASFDDFNTMVLHYSAAQEHGKALSMLAYALDHLLAAPPDAWDGGLTELWTNSEFPGNEPVAHLAHIRTMQVSARLARGKGIDWLINNLESLLHKCESGSWAHVVTAANLSIPLFRTQPQRSVKYLRAALLALPSAVMPDGAQLERILLILAKDVQTVEHLKLWLGAFSELDERRRACLTEESAFEDFVAVMVDRLWQLESEKPRSERQWSRIDAVLSDAAEVGVRLGAWALWIAATRARTVVLGEHLGRLDDVVLLGEAAMGQASTSHTSFMLNEAVGRQLVYAKRLAQARAYLVRATSEPGFENHPLMILALQNASWAIGADSPSRAVDYSDRAVSLAKTIAANQAVEVLKARGEQVVAHWLAGHREQAFLCLDDGAMLLCEHNEQSTEWRRVGLLWGRLVIGISDALSGHIPLEKLVEGTMPLLGRGMFHTWQPDPALVLDNRFKAMVAAKLCYAAETIGMIETGVRWAELGVSLAGGSVASTVIFTHPTLIDNRITKGDFEEVLGFAVALSNMMIQRREGVLSISREYLILLYGVVPIALMLAAASVTDRDAARVLATDAAIVVRKVEADTGMMFEIAASLLEQAFTSSASWSHLLRSVGDVTDIDGGLRLVGYICATGCADVGPNDAVSVWLAFAPAIAKEIGGIRPLWRCFLRLLTKYWTAMLGRSRFQFASPTMTEADLDAASKIPEERRAQAILSAVADGLRVVPSMPVQAWLRS